MPSTLLNIWDLIRNWRTVTKNNEDISWFFMLYQMMIMIFTVIGPGGIVLAVAGNCAKVPTGFHPLILNIDFRCLGATAWPGSLPTQR